MRKESKELIRAVGKKSKTLGEGFNFGRDYVAKFFGEKQAKTYHDIMVSTNANLIKNSKKKKKGKKKFSKKVR